MGLYLLFLGIFLLTGVIRVRLQAVDHMVVGLQQHQVLSRVSVPDEDMATIRATHHKVIPPETRLFNLHAQSGH